MWRLAIKRIKSRGLKLWLNCSAGEASVFSVHSSPNRVFLSRRWSTSGFFYCVPRACSVTGHTIPSIQESLSITLWGGVLAPCHFGSQGLIVYADLNPTSPRICNSLNMLITSADAKTALSIYRYRPGMEKQDHFFGGSWWKISTGVHKPMPSNTICRATQVWAFERDIVRGDRRTVKGLAVWQLHSFISLQHKVSAAGILVPKKQAATSTSSLRGKTLWKAWREYWFCCSGLLTKAVSPSRDIAESANKG